MGLLPQHLAGFVGRSPAGRREAGQVSETYPPRPALSRKSRARGSGAASAGRVSSAARRGAAGPGGGGARAPSET